VGFEQVRIGKMFDIGEAFKGGVNAGHEGRVLKAPDDIGVFFLGEIAQVALRVEIAKRIERHGLASRR